MLSFCPKCKKTAENVNPEVSKTSNGKIMLSNVQYVVLKNQKDY